MITLAEREGLEDMRPGQKTQESGDILPCNIQARQIQGGGLGEFGQWEDLEARGTRGAGDEGGMKSGEPHRRATRREMMSGLGCGSRPHGWVEEHVAVLKTEEQSVL